MTKSLPIFTIPQSDATEIGVARDLVNLHGEFIRGRDTGEMAMPAPDSSEGVKMTMQPRRLVHIDKAGIKARLLSGATIPHTNEFQKCSS
jgi:hypothetical protein